MNNRPAKDIMTSPVITIKTGENLSKFIDRLLENGINGMPVVDNDGRLEGIATRTDLMAFELKRELSSHYEKKIKTIYNEYKDDIGWQSFGEMVDRFNRTIKVSDIMTRELITAEENTPVKEICRIMKNNKINHIIITKDNKISGIITSQDIITLVADDNL